jgi:hypothetical protein
MQPLPGGGETQVRRRYRPARGLLGYAGANGNRIWRSITPTIRHLLMLIGGTIVTELR